ncbi:SusC/RagA family TonB-linked outer membrane protein [Galbibacter pacificus]|uniref:SusC/RagA family TonB-linked outer membrane protein n=1 Tax=Galbibacter pacificus TaxID=2996052 RepID=A0ABT6FUA3_9FLAO|nr:SusC/RagA family TonB-linked outer membrane protein [Galbibacter pacificus]MDG3583363.1 SusC/RagA family TonB-linked outer membrane protein [Galbibacter pacificus]MDG3586844.1 SusC/RagA family TonB-linked outer membrane protein [Galbibacter pacificus]
MQKKYILRDRCTLLFALLIFSTGTCSLFGNTKDVNLFDLAAYQHRIKGTVTDSNGIPIQGVNVGIKGSSSGTFSDEKGAFYLEAVPSDVLILSYIGFKKLEVAVGSSTELSLVLEEDVTDLGAVTVNAGYYTVTEKERTGSISKITSKSIDDQPVASPLAAMQGQMSGVLITQNTGVSGGGFNIQVRGVNSLRADGNAPLYIVDGVPFSSESLGSTSLSGAILGGASSPLNSINPSDIQSIEVLKDADATAIYGSRGANGVVLITTKKGKAGKTSLSLNTYTSAGTLARTMNLMDTQEYIAMRREAYKNDGIDPYPSSAYDVNGTWDQNRYTDWQKELSGGTAWTTNTQLGISGGNENTRFLISGTHRKETSVFPGDNGYHRTSVHNNLNHRSDDERFSMNMSVDYAAETNNQMFADLTSDAMTLPPNAPALYNEDGSLNWEEGTFSNPLADMASRYRSKTKNLIANGLFSYKVIPSLTAKISTGYTSTRLTEIRTLPSTVYNSAIGLTSANSMLFHNSGDRYSWIVEPQLEWNAGWGKNTLAALIGATFQTNQSETLNQIGRGFSSNELIESLAAAETVNVSNHTQSEYKYQAIYARVNYKWDGKYLINLTGRRDGSSRFGSNRRYATFGAVGMAWLFAREKFVENAVPWLSFGKVRASYGTTGNDQIGDYQYLNTYSVSGGLYDGVIGLQPSRLYNPDFGWEVNKKLEMALELGFLEDRISLTGAWYQNRSSNQLVGIPLPATTGFSSIQANLGATVENVGWEFDLRTLNVQGEGFKWTSSLNLSIPKNKLLEFENLEGSTYANQYVIGQPVNIQKLYHYTGINPDTGVYTFEDYDLDGQVSTPNDRQFLANIDPDFYGGLSNNIQYKNWNLDFLFQFVKQQGRNYLYGLKIPGAMLNMPAYVLDHWPENGTEAAIQRYTTGIHGDARNAYLRHGSSSAIISDASYIRLKNINVSYTIPRQWSKLFSARIYMQGQNLLTLTKYKGQDPESQLGSYIPPLKQYALGIHLEF